jgi:cytochrome c553
MAYDAKSDTLYVAGFGSDDVLAVTQVSQSAVHPSWQMAMNVGDGGCGPDGLAVDADNGNVLVYCSLTRKVVRLAGDPESPTAPTVVATSGELAKSRFSEAAQRGRALFRQGRNTALSTGGAMSCSSCHAEARTDGLSWFLQGKTLQTPLVGGRLEGTHPFKWDGGDHDLKASLTNTVKRLGGSGINAAQAKDLQAFLAEMEPPRRPSVEDAMAVERGRELFESDLTGCLSCHDGPKYTDQKSHHLSADLPETDTPSLIGLAASAPYYHDGSATTLEALLRGNGNIHGMGRTSKLSDEQISDLVEYLETL